MAQAVNTFLLVLAAIFPVVNPPGTALVFLALTQGAAPELRRELAWRVAKNALMVLVCSMLCGALILQFYGISIPILRLAGGYVVAVADGTCSMRAVIKAMKRPKTKLCARVCCARPSIR